MYIKNGNKKINCTDFSASSPAEEILFYLEELPELSNDKIYLYTDTGFCMRTVVRSEYEHEIISEFGDSYILTLTNITPSEDVLYIEDVRSHKIQELSNNAEQSIIMGFDIHINDDIKHFSLESHDQQNINTICQYLTDNADVSTYLYHADNEDITEYSREDMYRIRDKMLSVITENIEHYHQLRQQVKSATTIEEIYDIVF